MLSVPAQLGFEDRLHERAQQQAVVGGDEVDRPAHDADAHELPALEQLRHRLRPEVLEPRPERRVRVVRHLCLHPDEVVDGSSGARSERWSSSWRSSVARFSARLLRTGQARSSVRNS